MSAMSATSTARHAAPKTPPPAPSKRPTRYPLYADRSSAPTTPPPPAGLAETAIAPLRQPPAIAPAPEQREPIGVAERIARSVASGDPTWLMSFGVLVGALVAVFVLGCILVFI